MLKYVRYSYQRTYLVEMVALTKHISLFQNSNFIIYHICRIESTAAASN
jgi:hypothetical protein